MVQRKQRDAASTSLTKLARPLSARQRALLNWQRVAGGRRCHGSESHHSRASIMSTTDGGFDGTADFFLLMTSSVQRVDYPQCASSQLRQRPSQTTRFLEFQLRDCPARLFRLVMATDAPRAIRLTAEKQSATVPIVVGHRLLALPYCLREASRKAGRIWIRRSRFTILPSIVRWRRVLAQTLGWQSYPIDRGLCGCLAIPRLRR
jgi:hypothetical protein